MSLTECLPGDSYKSLPSVNKWISDDQIFRHTIKLNVSKGILIEKSHALSADILIGKSAY